MDFRHNLDLNQALQHGDLVQGVRIGRAGGLLPMEETLQPLDPDSHGLHFRTHVDSPFHTKYPRATEVEALGLEAGLGADGLGLGDGYGLEMLTCRRRLAWWRACRYCSSLTHSTLE